MHEIYEPVIIITDNHYMSNNRLAVLVYQTEPPYNKPHMLILYLYITYFLLHMQKNLIIETTITMLPQFHETETII